EDRRRGFPRKLLVDNRPQQGVKGTLHRRGPHREWPHALDKPGKPLIGAREKLRRFIGIILQRHPGTLQQPRRGIIFRCLRNGKRTSQAEFGTCPQLYLSNGVRVDGPLTFAELKNRERRMNGQFGWLLILLGLVLVLVGAVWLLAPSIPWLGRLPGDIVIERRNTRIYFPIATSLLLSAIATLLLWLFRSWRG